MDVLVIYQFCTFGGVERVILNRAKAFRKQRLDVKISIGYLRDRGALQSFKDYIDVNNLNGVVSPFILPADLSHKWDKYDYVFIIDTPEVFEATASAQNVYVECHTPYKQSRQYLGNMPGHVKGILVPAKSFKTLIQNEFSNLPEVFVMPNPVSDEFYNIRPLETEIFTKRPLTYFARVEDLKNFIEAARIFELTSSMDDVMYWIIGEGGDEKKLIHSLERKGLLERSILRDRVDFDKVPTLVNLVKRHRGIFISPSKGESFGLSAAEFMSGGVPVLLSDIPAHKELVENDDRFLYKLGNISSAAIKMETLLNDWDNMSERAGTLARKFREDNFLRTWQFFIADQQSKMGVR